MYTHRCGPAGIHSSTRKAASSIQWFPTPFPLVRVRADAKSYLDVEQYEAWTPLMMQPAGCAGDRPRRVGTDLLRVETHTPPSIRSSRMISSRGQDEARGGLDSPPGCRHGQAGDGAPGSVYWNEYRRRWVTIRCEIFGTSMLGETWYAEADTPLGPWVYARKIVTHDQYSFYNPASSTRAVSKRDDRILFFEGTYTYTFSGNPEPTPRYDYNQIMYKLDLTDERLALPVPVYELTDPDGSRRFATLNQLPEGKAAQPIAFFALDRPTAGAVAVYQRSTEKTDGAWRSAREGDRGRRVSAGLPCVRRQGGESACHGRSPRVCVRRRARSHLLNGGRSRSPGTSEPTCPSATSGGIRWVLESASCNRVAQVFNLCCTA